MNGELRLSANTGIGGIAVIVRSSRGRGRRDRGNRSERGPWVSRPSTGRSGEGFRRGHDPLLEASIGVIACLLRPDRRDAGRHDDLVIRWELHHFARRQKRAGRLGPRNHQMA
jgi:hypothetical protein